MFPARCLLSQTAEQSGAGLGLLPQPQQTELHHKMCITPGYLPLHRRRSRSRALPMMTSLEPGSATPRVRSFSPVRITVRCRIGQGERTLVWFMIWALVSSRFPSPTVSPTLCNRRRGRQRRRQRRRRALPLGRPCSGRCGVGQGRSRRSGHSGGSGAAGGQEGKDSGRLWQL